MRDLYFEAETRKKGVGHKFYFHVSTWAKISIWDTFSFLVSQSDKKVSQFPLPVQPSLQDENTP